MFDMYLFKCICRKLRKMEYAIFSLLNFMLLSLTTLSPLIMKTSNKLLGYLLILESWTRLVVYSDQIKCFKNCLTVSLATDPELFLKLESN